MPTAASARAFFATFAESLGVLCGLRFLYASGKVKIFTAKDAKDFRKGRKGNQEMRAAFLLIRFQYKYPGTPIDTIAAPQNASVGRVTIVFKVQAPPIST